MERNIEEDATAYSSLSTPHYEMGCDFVRSLEISEGDKVLDMGCGTGNVTNFIANLVGRQGHVVGVDPDEARIKIAREKFKDVKNLQFVVGDSSSRLPNDEQEYYDLHFSSGAFHWCVGEQKKLYLQKAHKCLKPGGRLAIHTVVETEIVRPQPRVPIEFLSEIAHKQLCENCSFTVVRTARWPFVTRFSTFDGFKAWFRASSHCDWEKMDPDWVKLFLEKAVQEETDGSVKVEIDMMFSLIAVKQTRA